MCVAETTRPQTFWNGLQPLPVLLDTHVVTLHLHRAKTEIPQNFWNGSDPPPIHFF